MRKTPLLAATGIVLMLAQAGAAVPPSQAAYPVNLGTPPYGAATFVSGYVPMWINTGNVTVSPFGLPEPVSDQSPLPVTVVGGGGGGGSACTTIGTPCQDNIYSFGGTTVSIGQQVKAASIPVTLASDQGPIGVTDNLTQVGGATINLGRAAMAASFPVVIASDQPPLPISGNVGLSAGANLVGAFNLDIGGSANASGNPIFAQIVNALPAGAAIIGRVGIDQTTPGTTNAVAPQGTVATAAPSSANGSTQGLRFDAGNRQMVNGSEVTQPVSGSVSVSNLPATQAVSGSVSISNLPATQTVSGLVSVSNLPSTQQVAGSVAVTNPGTPDVRTTGQTINAATSNAAVTFALANAQGTVGVNVVGTAAAGAVLTVEAANDGGTVYMPINAVAPGTGALSTTITADGNYRINAAGHTNIRLRVSTVGTGTITVADSASSVAGLVALSSPLPAGSNQIGSVTGNVGGYTGTAQATPTVQTSAYAAGQSVGGLLTLSGLVRPGQSGTLIQGVMLAFADAQTPSIDMTFFASNPSASTITNGSAISVAGADIGKVRGVVHITDCTSMGTTSVCQGQQQALSIVAAAAGGPIYAALTARSAMTLGSTSDLTVTVTGPQD